MLAKILYVLTLSLTYFHRSSSGIVLIFNLAARFAINNPLPHFFISIPFLSSAIILKKLRSPEMCNNYLFVISVVHRVEQGPLSLLISYLASTPR